MAELKIGEGLADLKKTIEKNRLAWKQIFAKKQDEWQRKLREKNNEIADFKARWALRETELVTQIQKVDTDIFDREHEKSDIILKRDKLKKDLLFEQTEKKKQYEKLHSATVITMKGEVRRRQDEANSKFREKEMKCELSKLRIKELEEQVVELTNRLSDDQKRWQDVLKMKGDDFTSLKNELVNKVKESQSGYKEEEKEAQILKSTHLELENKIKEKEKRIREEEAKHREQMTVMENKINKLNRELEWKKKMHERELITKEKDLELLKKEMDRFIEELTGGMKIKNTETQEEKQKVPIRLSLANSQELQPGPEIKFVPARRLARGEEVIQPSEKIQITESETEGKEYPEKVKTKKTLWEKIKDGLKVKS